MDPALEDRLRRGSLAVGVPMTPRIVDGLTRYLDALLQWNRRINLTAIRDPESIVDKHFVDSLAVIPHIPPTARSLADLGSGAGFPGAVIALARPDLTVTLIESIHKKTAFLEHLRRDLPLPNVTVLPLRAESWTPSPRPDAIVSRATWDLSDWLTAAPRWIRPGGTILAMEADTLHPLPAAATRHPYAHPSGTRAIVTLTAP